MLITSCSSGGAGNPTVVRAVQADPPVVGGNDHPAPSDTTADIPVEPFDDPGEPIAIDANVRTGKFVNGLTYYVRDNDNPGGSVELRLAIGQRAKATCRMISRGVPAWALHRKYFSSFGSRTLRA